LYPDIWEGKFSLQKRAADERDPQPWMDKAMSVSSMFNSSADALAAASDLKKVGFRDRSLHVVSQMSGPVTPAALTKKGISPIRADAYAQSIEDGRTLVIVETPLGSAKLATQILDRHHPNNSGVSQVNYEGYIGDESTPVSSHLRLPLLLKNAFPFSSFFGLPLLLKDEPNKTTSFGFPLLMKQPFPFSSLFGLKMLTQSSTPFSDFFGLPTLSKDKFPLSSALGIPLLSKPQINTD
jgi:hypothetical protein